VQDVGKAVRVKEGLGSQRTPGVARPKERAATGTPPRTTLMVELPGGGSQEK